jgi:hypothetical protein
VEKRQIWDNLILVQEAIQSSFTNNEKGMIIEIDMANAFDRFKHKFLNVVLEKNGFSQAFISWIGSCIKNPWIAPLINGRPTPFFKVSRGLRQGFPLSPILYVLMAEALNRRVEHEQVAGSIPCIIISIGVNRINNSQFLDDTLLMGGDSKIIARIFKFILDQYSFISGGLINKIKRKINAWNVSTNTLMGITHILQFSF